MATTKITSPDLFNLDSLNTELRLPSGTTAQRPTSPSAGEWRFNTSNNLLEMFDGSNWFSIQSEEIPPIPSEHFNTVLYDGTSATHAITGVGFQPDLVWIKDRSNSESHILNDSTRGASNDLSSNTTAAEANRPTGFVSFDSDGFTLGTDGGGVVNDSSRGPYVAWCWKANGGTTSSNTDGTITSTVQANTKAGFSIVQYSGTGSNSTVGHGLGATPKIVIIKKTSTTDNWQVSISNITGVQGQRVFFNLSQGISTDVNRETALPSSTLLSVGGQDCAAGTDYISYCFAEVDGFSKFGSYTGSSSNQYGNVFVSTGFQPAFVLIKQTNTSGANWLLFDNKRNSGILGEDQLNPNNADAEKKESGGNPAYVIFSDDGFQVNGNPQSINGNGASYIYAAFAADPTTTSPTLSDSFNIQVYNGDANTYKDITGYGFAPSLVWAKNTNSSNWHVWKDQLRSTSQYSILSSNLSGASIGSGANDAISEFLDDGWQASSNYNGGTAGLTNQSGLTYVGWAWKANNESANRNTQGTIECINSVNDAAGFSISIYNGNGVNGATVGHGLSSAPDIVLLKDRSNTENWLWGSSMSGWNLAMHLNLTNVDNASSLYWNNTAPTDTVVTLGSNGSNYNGTNRQYIQYNFRKIAGFSDFGSYTGTGSAGNAQNVGFAPSWLMIKRTVGSASQWVIIDSVRGTQALYADLANAETSESRVFLNSTGFEFTGSAFNETGTQWVYMAFKENPAQYAIPSGQMGYLVVAGGGGSGADSGGGAGAGAGGLRTTYGLTSGGGASAETNLTLATGTYTITVGAGGAAYDGSTTAQNGVASTITGTASVSTVGGGAAGDFLKSGTAYKGNDGGSGGGSANSNGALTLAGGAGTANEGFAGGAGSTAGGPGSDSLAAGGGGGAAQVGTAGALNTGGNGGNGLTVAITGSSAGYAGGGGGGCRGTSGTTAGQGGIGGGGDAVSTGNGNPGAANTGGGAGGGRADGANGGSGVVILRLNTSDYSGSTTGSPTITTNGSETILTYTGSGTYVHS